MADAASPAAQPGLPGDSPAPQVKKKRAAHLQGLQGPLACSACGATKPQTEYSRKQIERPGGKSASRRCKVCVAGEASASATAEQPPPALPGGEGGQAAKPPKAKAKTKQLACAQCGGVKPRAAFSNNQARRAWAKCCFPSDRAL